MDIVARYSQLIDLLREIGVMKPDEPLEELVIPEGKVLSDQLTAKGIPPAVHPHIFQSVESFRRDLDDLQRLTRVRHPFRTHAERLFAKEEGNPLKAPFCSFPNFALALEDIDRLVSIVRSVPVARLAGFIGPQILANLESNLEEFQHYEEQRGKWANVVIIAELRRFLWYSVECLEPESKVPGADQRLQEMAKKASEHLGLSYEAPPIQELETRGIYLPLVLIVVNELQSALEALHLDDRAGSESRNHLIQKLQIMIRLVGQALQVCFMQKPTDPQMVKLQENQENLKDIARQIRSLENSSSPEDADDRGGKRAHIIGDSLLQRYLPRGNWMALAPVSHSASCIIYTGLFPEGDSEALIFSFSDPIAKPMLMDKHLHFLICAEVDNLVSLMAEALGSGTWELRVQPSDRRLMYAFVPDEPDAGFPDFTLDIDSEPEALLFHLSSRPTPFLMNEIEAMVHRLNLVDNSPLLKKRRRLSFSFKPDGKNQVIVEFKRIGPGSEDDIFMGQISLQRVQAAVENIFVKIREIVEILNDPEAWNGGDAVRLMTLSLDMKRPAEFFLYLPGFQPAAVSLTDLARLLLDYTGLAAVKISLDDFIPLERGIFSQYPAFVARLEADRREMALGKSYRSRQELREIGFEKLVLQASEQIGSVVDEEMELLRITGDQESMKTARKIIKRLPALALYPVETPLAFKTVEVKNVSSQNESIINFMENDHFYFSDEEDVKGPDENRPVMDLNKGDEGGERGKGWKQVMREEQSRRYRGVALTAARRPGNILRFTRSI